MTVRTVGRWLGDDRRPLMGWLSEPIPGAGASGVVILPPIGYPYWCSHRTLRVTAERLAAQGHAVLRVDYDGTGDSAGDQWEPDRVSAWRSSVGTAVDEMRQLGFSDITLIGARLGATLALSEAQALQIGRVVAWEPVVSGRRYVREMRLLSTAVPGEVDPLEPPGTIVMSGSVFSQQTLEALGGISLEDLVPPPSQRTLVIDGLTARTERWVESARAQGAAIEHDVLPDSDQALETPPELGSVPGAIVSAICEWMGPAPGSGRRSKRRTRTEINFFWQSVEIREELHYLGSSGQVGVLSSPLVADPARSTLVLLNPGSESHVGPGRAWVEYARFLATRGYQAVRVDMSGWGESLNTGHAPGRPYDASGIEDAIEIAAELQREGHEKLVLLGLCASAWIALRAVLESRLINGVIALNPQMYWQQGDPVEIDWQLIRARRSPEIRRIQRGQRGHVWDTLDLLGHRGQAGAWLDSLAESGACVHLLFTEGDDGLQFLQQRLSRQLARVIARGQVRVREIPGVDHPMHRAWLRPIVARALEEELLAIDGSPRVPEPRPEPRTHLPAI